MRNRARGRGGERAESGQRAEDPKLELDQEKGGPKVRLGGPVESRPRAWLSQTPSCFHRPEAQLPRLARTCVPGEPGDARGSRAARKLRGTESS